VLAAPPLQEPIADQRLGSSIRLITLNGVDTLFAPLSFLVLREPRPTKVPTESASQRGSAPPFETLGYLL
jgi:hypothetical protein